jgi:6-pyruvoyltetrahydropterin/6-carboxytetrahydropterin synthase
MRVTICKQFDFDAAHLLPHVDPGHKCGRLHGHTYRVDIMCEGEPDPHAGWFVDYAYVALAWAPINEALDHRYLNDIPGLENPTTEVLAPWILSKLLAGPVRLPIKAVRVWESSTTWCQADSK